MATETEKQELMETLKFIPCNYRLEIYGYGGEIVMGKISQQAYEYWTDNEDELSEFACAWDESDFEIPEEAKIFTTTDCLSCFKIARIAMDPDMPTTNTDTANAPNCACVMSKYDAAIPHHSVTYDTMMSHHAVT